MKFKTKYTKTVSTTHHIILTISGNKGPVTIEAEFKQKGKRVTFEGFYVEGPGYSSERRTNTSGLQTSLGNVLFSRSRNKIGQSSAENWAAFDKKFLEVVEKLANEIQIRLGVNIRKHKKIWWIRQ